MAAEDSFTEVAMLRDSPKGSVIICDRGTLDGERDRRSLLQTPMAFLVPLCPEICLCASLRENFLEGWGV